MEKAVMYRFPRSGSTQVQQILNIVLKEKVFTTHDFIDSNLPLIIVLRDFRDVLISHWRIWFGRFDDGKLINSPTLDEILNTIKRVKDKIEVLTAYNDVYDGNKMLVLRYEEFYNNPKHIIKELERFLEVKIPEDKKELAIKSTSLEENRKRQKRVKITDKVRIFNSPDVIDGIHANHISEVDPIPGYWKQMVNPNIHQIIEEAFSEDLKFWGYK